MDADNVMKAVKDALNKVAYTDDRRVFDERSVKKWALPEDARLEVTVHFYPEITEANYGI
jgi:Holliday junction resolvase RusA-like endonuclease